ncbi:hypothetical protein H6G11_13050 [Cyanobacterium aponinum FACHB-4101]|uniref:hypothetical protein n=1 Tax=Cyanobacterium aponinum TaxID=379064 RepID=UPI001680FBC8|nr:hypothetical protein [Cyanobacterium aponinum]MBD2395177.1 hypothetical protein [Cyanobacterium aponinum FACHB-4101]
MNTEYFLIYNSNYMDSSEIREKFDISNKLYILSEDTFFYNYDHLFCPLVLIDKLEISCNNQLDTINIDCIMANINFNKSEAYKLANLGKLSVTGDGYNCRQKISFSNIDNINSYFLDNIEWDQLYSCYEESKNSNEDTFYGIVLQKNRKSFILLGIDGEEITDFIIYNVNFTDTKKIEKNNQKILYQSVLSHLKPSSFDSSPFPSKMINSIFLLRRRRRTNNESEQTQKLREDEELKKVQLISSKSNLKINQFKEKNIFNIYRLAFYKLNCFSLDKYGYYQKKEIEFMFNSLKQQYKLDKQTIFLYDLSDDSNIYFNLLKRVIIPYIWGLVPQKILSHNDYIKDRKIIANNILSKGKSQQNSLVNEEDLKMFIGNYDICFLNNDQVSISIPVTISTLIQRQYESDSYLFSYSEKKEPDAYDRDGDPVYFEYFDDDDFISDIDYDHKRNNLNEDDLLIKIVDNQLCIPNTHYLIYTEIKFNYGSIYGNSLYIDYLIIDINRLNKFLLYQDQDQDLDIFYGNKTRIAKSNAKILYDDGQNNDQEKEKYLILTIELLKLNKIVIFSLQDLIEQEKTSLNKDYHDDSSIETCLNGILKEYLSPKDYGRSFIENIEHYIRQIKEGKKMGIKFIIPD